MKRYEIVKVIAGWVVFDNFNRAQSSIYRNPHDAETLLTWLHTRWVEGRAS